jgi:endoglucanase
LNVHGGHLLRRATFVAGVALVGGALGAMPLAASAAPVPSGHTLAPNTHFYVPPPAQGSTQQALQLLLHGQVKDAALIADMEATPQGVWFDGESAAQVTEGTAGANQAAQQVYLQVRQTMSEAALQHAVPLLVAYNIPGRDCSAYSAGGAPTEAAYDQWIAAFAAGIGSGQAVVILEPDSLGKIPSNCPSSINPNGTYPIDNTADPAAMPPESAYPTDLDSYYAADQQRFAELNYGVSVLEADPNTSVYLDGTHSSWLSNGAIAQELVLAGVGNAQGFFLNVSNYQPDPELVDYGTWTSDCIALATDDIASNWMYGHYSYCQSQYYPATQNNSVPWETNFATWGLTTTAYAGDFAETSVPTTASHTHFVIDTSRNGQGPNDMQSYLAAPYNQPASDVSTLVGGNWCNPPASGLGVLPTANTGVPLLDAYLWVKVPGQSDGQCDAAGGVRAWDYTDYTQPTWPTTASARSLFDPLWGQNDPAAGAWFSQQALQLAENANPALNFPFKT